MFFFFFFFLCRLVTPARRSFAINVKEKMSNIFDGRKYLAQLTSVQKALLNEVINVMKLVMVMPATNWFVAVQMNPDNKHLVTSIDSSLFIYNVPFTADVTN